MRLLRFRATHFQERKEGRYDPLSSSILPLPFSLLPLWPQSASPANEKGKIDLSGSSLRFGPIATTRTTCPPQSLGDRFPGYLSHVRGFVIQKGELYLSLMSDGGIMRFRPVREFEKKQNSAADSLDQVWGRVAATSPSVESILLIEARREMRQGTRRKSERDLPQRALPASNQLWQPFKASFAGSVIPVRPPGLQSRRR